MQFVKEYTRSRKYCAIGEESSCAVVKVEVLCERQLSYVATTDA